MNILFKLLNSFYLTCSRLNLRKPGIGGWLGKEGIDNSIFPVRYLEDYVRVYLKNHFNNTFMKNLNILAIFLFYCFIVMGQPQKEVILLDQPGFPFMFELNPGESQLVTHSYQGNTIRKNIKLIAVHAFSEPNYWFPDTMEQKDYYQFIVDLEVNGKPISLYHRPYQMPVSFEGLRIYIENIKHLIFFIIIR